ncbi:MAG TPA: L-2-hydroxyglutarate oxidase [Nitrospira sp.]
MLVNPTSSDFLVVGAGVIGVSIARELKRRYAGTVTVLEKESAPGRHASGRNSGVLHAGVYYKAGTLKARLCVEGNRHMREYCRMKNLPLNAKGKVIVTRNSADLPALDELYARSQANGVRVERIDSSMLKDIEPYAKTLDRALYVRDTAVVDPERVMSALVDDAKQEKIDFRCDDTWRARSGDAIARTSSGDIPYGHFVNCAGLYADTIAHQFGVGTEYRILPFRGQFHRLRPESRVTVLGNIYPVPDLRNPFLGVHFTRTPSGDITVGPSALPLLGREQYGGVSGARFRDGLAMISYLLRLWGHNRDHFRSTVWQELRKLSRRGFYREAAPLVRDLIPSDLIPGKRPGIRAQLVNTRTAELLNDFLVESGPRSTHILNAVSPAFTCSAPFAAHVVDHIRDN